MTIKRKHIIITAALLLVVITIVTVSSVITTEKTEKYFEVKKGKFEAVLTCKGEINGLHATEIRAPKVFQNYSLRLYQMKISDLTQDGKTVKKGDFIAQLDASSIMTNLRTEQQKLETAMSDMNNAKIDSAIKLSQKREEIKNALLDLEYNKIDLEQSVYESEAYQRKVQMTYQKTLNNITKLQRDYQMETNNIKMRVKRFEENVNSCNDRISQFKEAMASCRITAPTDGIVIFGTSWDGKKVAKDQYIITLDYYPPIATLPDMSEVISEIYVKEIDIAKVEKGDSVLVTFDAIDELALKGHIKEIAKMGEDHNGFDMRVFKVTIYLDENDPRLKPAMSSNNEIVLENDDNAISVPLNAVFMENNTKYVYLKKEGGIIKQPIKTGLENEEFVKVIEGLSEGDLILLDAPENNMELVEN